jgi:hypothetical protein
MESSEHQEWRSRQQLSVAAALKSAFVCGLVFFYMSGGSPWSSAGTMNMIMGRDIKTPFIVLALGHAAVSVVYTLIIAVVIYRLKTPLAVPMGILVGMGLYALNVLVFRSAGLTMQSPEFVTWFVHFVFSLFASLLYKAFSIPKPLEKDF